MAYFTNQYRKSYQRPLASRLPAATGPREIVAKFASVCRNCQGPIAIGEAVLWAPGVPAVHVACPVVEAPVVSPEAQAVAALSALRGKLEVEDAGVYKLLDGTVVKVQANREKTRVYAKRLVERKGIDRLTEDAGHVHADYVYEAGLIAQVEREGVKLSLEEAKALSIRYAFCIRCGRHLVDGKSVEQGMGPVCITYFS